MGIDPTNLSEVIDRMGAALGVTDGGKPIFDVQRPKKRTQQ
jgi:hypothetical protein